MQLVFLQYLCYCFLYLFLSILLLLILAGVMLLLFLEYMLFIVIFEKICVTLRKKMYLCFFIVSKTKFINI